jgi:hypothetical protein
MFFITIGAGIAGAAGAGATTGTGWVTGLDAGGIITRGCGATGVGAGQWQQPAANIKAPVPTRTEIQRLERTIFHLSCLLFAQDFCAVQGEISPEGTKPSTLS